MPVICKTLVLLLLKHCYVEKITTSHFLSRANLTTCVMEDDVLGVFACLG